MRKILFLSIFVAYLIPTSALPQQLLQTFPNQRIESFDEFDQLIDEAIDNGAIKKNIELKPPSPFLKAVGRVSGPFLQAYTYVVLKFRGFKGWVKKRWPARNGNQESNLPVYENSKKEEC